MTKIGLLALAGACLATAAAAEPAGLEAMTPGHTYYNRAGASVAEHDADVAACAAEAARVRTGIEMVQNLNGPAAPSVGPGSAAYAALPIAQQATAAGAVGGAIGLAIGNAINARIETARHHGLTGAAVENCMVVRGWNVVRLPEPEGAAWAALDQTALAARLAPQIGAAQPQGEFVRRWNNEAARGSTPRIAGHPHTNDGLLSLKASTGLVLDKMPTTPDERRVTKADKAWRKAPIAPAQLPTDRPDAAIVVIRMKNVHMGSADVVFARMGDSPLAEASVFDMANPDVMDMIVPPLFAKAEGNLRAFILKPGRWRLSAMAFGGTDFLSLCLGSPSFEAKAGDVLFLGSFDWRGEDFSPDMDMTLAKAFLAPAPWAAAKLAPAAYTNGSVGRCGDAVPYAIEFKGAAFDPAYKLGGARVTAGS